MPPKTTIEKLSSSVPDVTVFKITGTLGFHEKTVLERLFNECNRRGLARVLFEVSELESLGGGCASIIRDEAKQGRIAIGLVGARRTVLKFLKKEDAPRIVVAESVDEATPHVLRMALAHEAHADPDVDSDDALLSNLEEILELGDAPADEEDAEVALDAENAEAGVDVRAEPEPAPEAPQPEPEQPRRRSPAERRAAEAAGEESAAAPKAPAGAEAPSKDLQKRVVQYNTLFSINSEFHRFQDRKSLLDAFLLTAIAQFGVESAVFMERNRGYFVPVAMKGIEPGELRGFAVSEEQLKIKTWKKEVEVQTVEKSRFGDDVKAPLLALGCTYVVPFIVHGDIRGIVLLGRPIKNELDASNTEFLKIMINQAAIAYESMSRFEEENERTLGIVQTLISLIEENTLARGNTNLVTNYVFALATRQHYPQEYLRDLMYGTVLRDIGMIKVSDLIVRSPRELMPEEWEIIKQHPTDGSKMLTNMKFSSHVTDIVLHHHERFNGEGYPNGKQGQDIPLGARIVSVVESYAAMLQERPTRPALSREEALNTLKENWGMRYDPEVVRGFIELLEEEIRSGKNLHEKKFAMFSV
ncbi:MAG: HD domain-containing protein [Candidatus Krumholzibacteria bacterium]|nr:HD domain-containing protein [Candidatus Krumholzibacteria bacterium]MDH4337547.1 HD domain-containing protein [Candidatus Krumholzibacteria bacterium]MDH5269926.1 HD domain-containing protein [Candidatus Krumholzibacteria bacterium]MDH5626673.1 HD domain-containing protein [Candidatus Krumholzibacteria bacterium]